MLGVQTRSATGLWPGKAPVPKTCQHRLSLDYPHASGDRTRLIGWYSYLYSSIPCLSTSYTDLPTPDSIPPYRYPNVATAPGPRIFAPPSHFARRIQDLALLDYSSRLFPLRIKSSRFLCAPHARSIGGSSRLVSCGMSVAATTRPLVLPE